VTPRLACLLLLATVATAAAEVQQPIVRLEATPEQVRVGEPLQLRVTVLVPTWFQKPPVFPTFEIANAVTRLPPDSSFPTSERVNNETWSGIVRDYRIYPLSAAAYSLRGLTMKVTYANPGGDPRVVDVDLPEVGFRGVVPEGAETLDPYIAGSSLTLEREIEGATDDLKAGDAVVVRYVVQLDGLPAMFLPPMIEAPAAPGLAAYLDEPDVSDGEVARRSEQLTLVFDAGGTFEVPGVSLDWWNTAAERIETTSVPPLALTVAGPPPAGAEPESGPMARFRLLGIVVAMLVVFALLLKAVPIARRKIEARAERRRQTEAYAFGAFRKAAASGDEHAAYDALLAWLYRIDPGADARRFAQRFGDEALVSSVDKLTRALFGNGGEMPDLRSLSRSFGSARRRYLAAIAPSTGRALPELNP